MRANTARAAGVMVLVTAGALLSGCASLLGLGDDAQSQSALYAPDPRVAAEASWPTATWQLSIGQTSAARVIDSFRIIVRPTPAELQVYKGASWAKLPTDMIEDALSRALEDSGRIGGVARQGSGVAADYKLVMDMRRFEADYAGNAVPSATIEINAKLLHTVDQRVAGSRTFTHAEPATSADIRDVVDAFSRSLSATTREMSAWVLQTGNAHSATAHVDAASPTGKRN